jgi:HSP20 family protein
MTRVRNGKIPGNRISCPEVEFTDTGEYYQISANLPGVLEENIRIDLENNTLKIFATNDGKKYQKTITIPGEFRVSQKKFRDGVLNIVLEKAGEGQPFR